MKTLKMKMILVVLAVLTAMPAAASPLTDKLGTCMADSTSGKERKELARWIFLAMAAHPELKDLSVATPAARDQVLQSVGLLVTRLLTQNCAQEARAAVTAEGSKALEAAFEILGKVAMQELMSNSDVETAIGGFEKFIDHKKVEAALTPP